MHFHHPRRGQSLIELLVGMAVGTAFLVGTATLIAPSLQASKQAGRIQAETELASELETNVRSWAGGNWDGVLALATGTANTFYLSTATSSFTVVASGTVSTSGSTSTVAIDAVGPNSGGAWAGGSQNATTLSWTHTVTSTGQNPLLVAGITVGSDYDAGLSLAVTYDGTPMNSAGVVHGDNQSAGFTQLFYLASPTPGAHLVQATLSGGTADLIGGSISFTGVNQSTPLQNIVSNYGGSAAISVTVNSAPGDMVVDTACTGSGFNSSNQTSQWTNNLTGETGCSNGAQSTAAGTSSVTMGYNVINDWWGIIGADVVAASAPGTTYYEGGKSESVTVNGITFTRSFYLSDAYRDSGGNATTSPSGNNYDPSTKFVTVVVVASTTPAAPPLTTSFYLTRNEDNAINQTSWSGGSGQTSPVSIVGTNYADETNISVSATGTIELSAGGGSCVL